MATKAPSTKAPAPAPSTKAPAPAPSTKAPTPEATPETPPEAPTLEERLRALEAQNAALEAQNAALETKLMQKEKRKPRAIKDGIEFQYKDLEPFKFGKRESSKSDKKGFFSYLYQFLGTTKILAKEYKENPSEELAKLAEMLHQLIVKHCDAEFKEKTYFSLEGLEGDPRTDKIKKLIHAYTNYTKSYIILCATFKDHIEPNERWIMEIDKLRNAAYN